MRQCMKACACVKGGEGHASLQGTVHFLQRQDGTLVTVDISGLPDSETGFYGFHIHETGDCGGEGFANTGAHFDPKGRAHPMHAGDLPPLLGCRGRACFSVLTDRFSVKDIIGRSVVIHSHPDDFMTQPSGDSGMKIGCGVIKMEKQTENW